MGYKIGELIRPADGSNYRGEIVYISKKEDRVLHRCLTTGEIKEKSYMGFISRYCSVEEYAQVEELVNELT